MLAQMFLSGYNNKKRTTNVETLEAPEGSMPFLPSPRPVALNSGVAPGKPSPGVPFWFFGVLFFVLPLSVCLNLEGGGGGVWTPGS